jgi:hypothetical protein
MAATGVSMILPPMQFASAAQTGDGTARAAGAAAPADGTTATQSITGHLDPGAADWVYLPVDVPHGVRQIGVSYTYDKPAEPSGTVTNSLDLGIFDQRGIDLRGKGFRGWSGGARTTLFVAAEQATPGYEVPAPFPGNLS